MQIDNAAAAAHRTDANKTRPVGTLSLKGWCLLVGLLVGGGIGFLTRPKVVELKIGNQTVEVSKDNKVTAKPFEHMTGDELHELTFAAFGGIIGLLAGIGLEYRRGDYTNG